MLDELSKTAQRLLEESEHDVAWVEKSEVGSGRRALVVAPLSVAGTLATHLYDERTVVATSATLTLGGRFDTVARSLGLADAARPLGDRRRARRATAPAGPPPGRRGRGSGPTGRARVRAGSLDVGSPFDYARQGILYVAAHLPRPSVSGLPDAAGEELLALVDRARRAYPRALLVPAGRAAGRRSCSGHGPTCRCCCRARRRCRCWYGGSARSARAACSG